MKQLIILINIILAGSVVHAMDKDVMNPSSAGVASGERTSFYDSDDFEPSDISPLVRYEGEMGWSVIPEVKAEIDRLRDATTKLQDAIRVIKEVDDSTVLGAITPGDVNRKSDRVEWYGKAFDVCKWFIKLTEILASDNPARINKRQEKISETGGEILNNYAFHLKRLEFPASHPLALEDSGFKFSSVSNPEWSLLDEDGMQNALNGDQYVSPLIDSLCISVINIKKMLGFQRNPKSFVYSLYIGEE
jgi:hypothetical protein